MNMNDAPQMAASVKSRAVWERVTTLLSLAEQRSPSPREPVFSPG
jgi:hypothetical protein